MSRGSPTSPTVQKSLRIPQPTARLIEELAEWTGRDFSTLANELLAEAAKLRRCPGIIFVDGAAGRRARIAGTGLEVWELIATSQSLEHDGERLREAYHWLTEAQVRAALGYYAAYRAEIDDQIARNARWTAAELARQYPSLNPSPNPIPE